MRLWYLSHTGKGSGEPAHVRSIARAFTARTCEVWKQMKGPIKNQTSSPTGWLHVRLKNELAEDEMHYNLVRLLI